MKEVRYRIPGEVDADGNPAYRVGFLPPDCAPPAEAVDVSYRNVALPTDGDFGAHGDQETVSMEPNTDPPKPWDQLDGSPT